MRNSLIAKTVFFQLLFVLLLNTVFSQEKVAILVANQNYKIGNKLKTPINDIIELKKTFENKGFKTILFEDITIEDFNGKLMDSIRKVLSGDHKKTKLLFHYAGHGIQIDNENYFVPIDMEKVEYKSDLKRKCFNVNNLLELLNEISEDNTDLCGLISIDACRINPFSLEGVTQGLAPAINNKIYNHFGVLYAVGVGQTASDGNDRLSPYVKGLLKGINSCEDLKLVSDRIVAEYYNENLDKEPYFEGSLNFSFCEQNDSKNILSNDWTEEYKSILNLLTVDFLNEKYSNLLVKAALINRIVLSNGVQINKQSDEYLQFELHEAIAHFELGQYKEALPQLLKLSKKTLFSNTFEIFQKVYFYLGRLYTIEKRWDDLHTLRNEYLKYLLENNNLFDAAITFDKIAGDFEHQNQQDSAKIYYKKAIDLFDEINHLSSEQKHYASLVNKNIGNCYAFGENIDHSKSLIYLQKALNLSFGNNTLEISNLTDLIGVELSLDTSSNIKQQIINNINYQRKLCEKAGGMFDRFLNLDLAVTYYKKYGIIDSLEISFKQLNDLIIKENPVILENDTLLLRNVDNSCSIYSRQISLILPQGVLPVLFFDKNKNQIFDDRDYRIVAEKCELDTVLVNEYGSNSTEQWVTYNDIKRAKNSGIFYLSHNNSHLKSPTSKYSYCIVFPQGDKTVWQFRIDCTELDVSKSNFFVGLKNTNIREENQILNIDQTIRFIPIASFSNNYVRFSRSTLE